MHCSLAHTGTLWLLSKLLRCRALSTLLWLRGALPCSLLLLSTARACTHARTHTQPQAKETWEVTDAAEKLQVAEGLKDQGNKAFKAGAYERAQRRYERAEQFIECVRVWYALLSKWWSWRGG